MTNVLDWIRFIVVILEKIEYTETKNFKSDACVTMVVKPIQDFDAQTKRKSIRRQGKDERKMLLTAPLPVCLEVSLKHLFLA